MFALSRSPTIRTTTAHTTRCSISFFTLSTTVAFPYTAVAESQSKCITVYPKTDDPFRAVRDITKIVAVDPPTAKITMPISSFNRAMTCRRSKKEYLAVFVSRFRSLPVTHLQQGNASPSSKIGPVLSITLLNNPNLDENALTQ